MSSLIIDDRLEKVAPLIQLLTFAGIETYRAETIEEALSLLGAKGDKVTSIFVDGSLLRQECPFLDEVDFHGEHFSSVVRAIREDPVAHLPRRIIAISATESLRLVGGDNGCDEGISPDVPEEFVNRCFAAAVRAEQVAAAQAHSTERLLDKLPDDKKELAAMLLIQGIFA